MTELEEWHRWRDKFKERGLASNVRVATSYIDGWLAFADSNLFVDIPKMTDDDIKQSVSRNYENLREKSTRPMFVVSERAEPQEFHHLERAIL